MENQKAMMNTRGQITQGLAGPWKDLGFPVKDMGALELTGVPGSD